MTRIEQLGEVLISGKTIDFFTEYGETIIYIDIESNIIEYFVSVTSACGCCGENEFREDSLSHFLEFMSDDDFSELLKHLSI
jgi:hypothetical protein